MGRVDGKVALITGAARGQGRSHALRLAAEGADIIAVDICSSVEGVPYSAASSEDLSYTVQAVESLGQRIVSAEADVRDRAALKDAIDAGAAELGHLDIVIANAGVLIPSSWDEITPEIWATTLGINLTGVFNTVQLSAPHMIAHGRGSVILISSAAGLKALPFLMAYGVSKHGVVGIMRGFSAELAEYNIRVNSIHPTGVRTEMGGKAVTDQLDKHIAEHPRLGPIFVNQLHIDRTEPEDVTSAVLFLASDESRHITGLTMTVDAGNTQY